MGSINTTGIKDFKLQEAEKIQLRKKNVVTNYVTG